MPSTRRQTAASGAQLYAISNPDNRRDLQTLRNNTQDFQSIMGRIERQLNARPEGTARGLLPQDGTQEHEGEEVEAFGGVIPVQPAPLNTPSHEDRVSVRPSVRSLPVLSMRSGVTMASSLRRKMETEEKLAEIREKRRQNRLRLEEERAKAEEERLRDEEELVEMRSRFEDNDEDRRSNVLSTSSGKPDVEKWVAEQAKTVGFPKPTSDDHAYLEAPENIVNVHKAKPDNLLQEDRPVELAEVADPFQRMANSIENAMKNVVQSIRPTGDFKHLAARQGSAKDLPEFHGKPEEWPGFLGTFERSTDLCGYTDQENVARLDRCLKGKARDVVGSMLTSKCSLKDIMEVLKMRFGRPRQIIMKLLEKARSTPAPPEGDFPALLDFSLSLKNFCCTAAVLNQPLYINNPQLVEEFQQKLPAHLQLDWGRHLVKSGTEADLKQLSLFLDEVATAAIHICQDPISQPRRNRQRDQCFVVTDVSCPLKCKEAHDLTTCKKFLKMKKKDRWDCVKKLRVCFSCLGKGHSRQKCSNRFACDKDGCKQDHHPLLHYTPKNETDANVNKDDRAVVPDPNLIGIVSQVHIPASKVLMKVVPVQLSGPKGKITVNAFLDDGASLTIIEEKIANDLGLKGDCHALHLNWLGEKTDSDENSRVVSLKIRGIAEKEEHELVNVRTMKQLALPMMPLSNYKLHKRWNHLNSVPFPEVLQQRPMIIIGEDNIHLIIGRKLIEGPRNAPVASWTHLGWAIHGPSGKTPLANVTHSTMVSMENVDPDQALHDLVKEQFRLESLGIINCQKLPMSKMNERANYLMEAKSHHAGDGWETVMLWKSDDTTLPESYSAAYRRLKVLEKQMDKDSTFSDMYCIKIQEYIDKGFCRKLSEDEARRDNARTWYLPHFGRTNPNKPGKLRLVFDCAAKVNGMSLNDALLQGPDLMSPLINVLLKFRQREVAFSGDIRDMFHMVKICKEDGPALRFLWRGKDRSLPPSVYQMDAMVFGAVDSPFKAQWIKNRNALKFEEQFPEAVDAIVNRHYVDDYLDSCKTPEEAINRITEVREIHRRGGFEIRGWLCNNPGVLKIVAPENVQNAETLVVKEEKLERVLGLHWDPKTDVFKFKTSFRNMDPKIIAGEKVPTKRELLKLIMSLFDPLGFIAHLTVRGRMLLQDVWKSSIGWDDKLKPELEKKWSDLLQQILKIPDAEIRRCFAPEVSDAKNIQLHVLCDASQQAFSCSAYLRVVGSGGEISVNLVMAKSRVAPVKPVSIPRLEMEAALMGARMCDFIRKNLDLRIDSYYIWSDSRNVLCWIRSDDPGKYKVYIAHRIGEIRDLTEVSCWRWVPTAENVADDATRDSTPADVSPESRWYNGPTFLWKLQSEWPVEKPLAPENVKQEDLELKRNCCLVVTEKIPFPINVCNFSKWFHLVRVIAWIRRFIGNFAAKHGKGNKVTHSWLSTEELENARRILIIEAQKQSFAEELTCLAKRKPLPKSSRIAKLSPVSVDGVLSVRSRIVRSPDLSEDTKYPVILDPKCHITKLLVAWYHEKFGHHGREMISNELRQRYWVLDMKAAVKRAWRDCNECQTEDAKPIIPQMAPLPKVRVTKPSRPFSFVGVDYFGPLDVVNGRKHQKRYGVLFTCLSTRAVHLEVAFSLSTDDFMMAFHRFICRRGEPIEVWSDNGSNFRGADKEIKMALQEMKQEIIIDKLAARNIKWNFNPPGAPHMGGAWERLVRSVKIAMNTVLKNMRMNDQVLATVLTEAEATVNSRPITTVSCDKDDPEALTPNCFLMGTTGIMQPPGVFNDADLCSRKRWRHVQVIANHFWKRWLKEFLPTLSLRGKWNHSTPNVTVGELVFVADLNEMRNRWTKAVVVAVYPGPDGQIRIVDVKTAVGILRRPVAKLLRINGWIQEGDSTA